jgi:hypothetical protein
MVNADLRIGLISRILHVQDQRWFYALLSVTGLFYLITFICICLSYRHQRSPLTQSCGSEFFPFRISDPHQRNLSILTQKNGF